MTGAEAGAGDADGGPPLVVQVTDDLVLIEVAGRRLLAEAHCPHRKGRLRFGHVDGTRLSIRCQLHHSTFDLLDGAVVTGPACAPLRVVAHLPDAEGGDAQGR